MHPDPADDLPCRCGHPRSAHEHYRSGSECSLCGECRRYRPPRRWWHLFARQARG